MEDHGFWCIQNLTQLKQKPPVLTGLFSANLDDRIRKHNCLSKGFSSNGRPWVLMYSEFYPTKEGAMAREKDLTPFSQFLSININLTLF